MSVLLKYGNGETHLCAPEEWCNLGFGAVLCLIPHPNIDVKEMPVLGHIASDDPNVKQELIKMAIKQEKIRETSTTSSTTTATASAGSAAQLTRVESELREIPPKASVNQTTITYTPSKTQATMSPHHHIPQINCKPFAVQLARLSESEIKKYTGIKTT